MSESENSETEGKKELLSAPGASSVHAHEFRIRELAWKYYKRRDVQREIFAFSQGREVVPFYFSNFGKRPDMLQYPADIAALAERGATSFHCSEELWRNPLELRTEMKEQELNLLREGWDLLLDIDGRFFEYNKIAAELLLEALRFHGVHSFSLKYSGSKGFHIFVPWQAFPAKLHEIEVKNFFPAGPRYIAAYLKELISKHLASRILELNSTKEIAHFLKKKESELFVDGIFNPFFLLEIDTILISSRHLFRMPYSLHEKTGLVSVMLKPQQLKLFRPDMASPGKIFARSFLPQAEKNEASELLIQAYDFASKNKIALEEKEKIEKRIKTEKGKSSKISEIKIKDLSSALYPPCISNILAGIKQDGRKRALFVLLNFFRSLEMPQQEIEATIKLWNTQNYKQLREGYILSQLTWHARQKRVLPPNCDKSVYKDIGVCAPDGMCKFVKNPVNYVLRKARLQSQDKSAIPRQKRKDKKV